MRLTLGTRLGPYEIVAVLGAGGMGEVYRARDTRLGRDVAIKILPEDVAADADRRRRFEQEARAVAALNHPHICQLHDVGPEYLVFECIDGEPPRGPMSVARAVPLALQIASALEAAHRRDILHRDLKPGNILITRDGTAKLLDFGLASMNTAGDWPEDETRTAPGVVLGTAAYMSPEQVQGRPLDARSDVFSFGTVLYELVSGAGAFAGHTMAEIMSAVLRDDPVPLRESPALDRIVRQCLRKDPAQRFQTMAEVRVALEQLSATPADTRPSIAVLPFENMSGDKENEYFSDGLAEEIINALTRIPGLKVIARTSAFAFKGRHEDIRRIAEVLGVTTVLEGSVRRAGSRIRVTAQLITAADGSHLWSERYDREMTDVFAIQDDIAAAITEALQVTLSAAAVPGRRDKPDLAAYEHYLKALYESEQWTPQSTARAREYLERAIALDPRFALAHAELAHVLHRTMVGAGLPPRETLPLLRQEARRALEIDAMLPEGRAMLGTAAALYDYDWPEAERQFRLAFENEAVTPRVHQYYAAYYLAPQGRSSEALHHYGVFLRDDPLNRMARAEHAILLRVAGRSEEADDELRRVAESDDTWWFPYYALGMNAMLDGRPDEAFRIAETAYRLAPWFKPIVGLRAAMLMHTGDVADAAPLVEDIRRRDRDGDALGPAVFHMLRGELDEAADWVREAILQRQPAVLFFLACHAQALKSTSRWPALAKMMNLA